MTRLVFAIGLAAAALCGAARADLIVNGSFEEGAYVPANGYAMVIEPGASVIAGWEAINASFAWIGPGDPWGIDAGDGARFLDLTGWRTGAPFGGVRQAVTTISGHQYRLSLALGSSSAWGRPSAVTVSAGDTVQTFTSPTTGSTNDWQRHEMTFPATAARTTISIAGSAGADYIGLDDVSLVDLSADVVIGGREWRQLKDTTYVTWNEVAAVCPVDGATPCRGSILRSQDGALIDVTGWTWARNADIQALWEAIVQPGTTNFPDPFVSYTKIDDADIQQALSSEPGWFEPTAIDSAARTLFGLSADLGATGAYRPWIRDAIKTNTDWVKLGQCCLARTSRQSYTGAWLFRPYGTATQLSSLKLKASEVAGCKSVTGTVVLSAPAPAGGVIVTLSDTLAAAVTPVSLKLLEGASSKTFTVKTVPVAGRQSGSVSATLGSTTRAQPLTLRPIGMLSVTLTPTTVVGSQPVAGSARLECKAGPGPITVDLAGSDAAVAWPVATIVVVPQGVQSAAFDVTTGVVLARTKTTLAATANGITKSRTLYVTPAAVVSPTSLKFGSVKVGTMSAPLVATLTNKGRSAFVIDGIVVSGTYAAWFPMTDNCPASLAAGASCTISVKFAPLAAASRSAKVSIASSATSTPVSVSVSGVGVP